jgi:hypothetical protein
MVWPDGYDQGDAERAAEAVISGFLPIAKYKKADCRQQPTVGYQLNARPAQTRRVAGLSRQSRD